MVDDGDQFPLGGVKFRQFRPGVSTLEAPARHLFLVDAGIIMHQPVPVSGHPSYLARHFRFKDAAAFQEIKNLSPGERSF